MSSVSHIMVATALAGILSVASLGTVHAADATPLPATMKPVSGEDAAAGEPFLLSFEIGRKQAVTYFQNEGGLCTLTLMVAEAFNGEEIPNETTVRFKVAIDPAKSAMFDTAEGKGLEFTCQAGAQTMSVKPLDQVAGFPPAM